MSAPQIPNLNTFRRDAPRGRGRGRGRPTSAATAVQPTRQLSADEVVRRTDGDAATSRLSAVEAGYLDDPFAKLLFPSSGGGGTESEAPVRRLPLMNRGTYVRTTAIDKLVSAFLASQPAGQRTQIVSLGAGSDTRFFRLRRSHLLHAPSTGSRRSGIVYHEFDLAENTRAKIARLRNPAFVNVARRLCGFDVASAEVHIADDASSLSSPCYSIHAQDLRLLPDSTTSMIIPNLDSSLPTLLISECCLCYLSPGDAESILAYFGALLSRGGGVGGGSGSTTPSTTTAPPLGVIIYEPIRPHDAFGRTMVSNLTARGIHLQTLHANATLEAQRQRLRRAGFGPPPRSRSAACSPGAGRATAAAAAAAAADDNDDGETTGDGSSSSSSRNTTAAAADIDFIWRQWVDDAEKERVDALEWMDEIEEFTLLARHYCVAYGWRRGEGGGSANASASGYAFPVPTTSPWNALPTQDEVG